MRGLPRTGSVWFKGDHRVFVLQTFGGPEGELFVETAPVVLGGKGGRLLPLRLFWRYHEPHRTPLGEQVMQCTESLKETAKTYSKACPPQSSMPF